MRAFAACISLGQVSIIHHDWVWAVYDYEARAVRSIAASYANYCFGLELIKTKRKKRGAQQIKEHGARVRGYHFERAQHKVRRRETI